MKQLDRNLRMLELRHHGETYRDLAKIYGISQQGVQKILKQFRSNPIRVKFKKK